MDYPCGKFGDCSFSRFGSIVRTDTQTQTDANERFTPATLVGVNN